MNNKEIEKKAKKMVSNHEEDVDILAIAKENGFAIGNAEMTDDIDGFIIVDNKAEEIFGIETNKLIGVNANLSIEWKRFIIAHELGHYVLHYEKEKDKNGFYAHRDHGLASSAKPKKEKEADYFAANILMPTKSFKNRYNKFKEKGLEENDIITLLAKHFIVEERAVKRRIVEVNEN